MLHHLLSPLSPPLHLVRTAFHLSFPFSLTLPSLQPCSSSPPLYLPTQAVSPFQPASHRSHHPTKLRLWRSLVQRGAQASFWIPGLASLICPHISYVLHLSPLITAPQKAAVVRKRGSRTDGRSCMRALATISSFSSPLSAVVSSQPPPVPTHQSSSPSPHQRLTTIHPDNTITLFRTRQITKACNLLTTPPGARLGPSQRAQNEE